MQCLSCSFEIWKMIETYFTKCQNQGQFSFSQNVDIYKLVDIKSAENIAHKCRNEANRLTPLLEDTYSSQIESRMDAILLKMSHIIPHTLYFVFGANFCCTRKGQKGANLLPSLPTNISSTLWCSLPFCRKLLSCIPPLHFRGYMKIVLTSLSPNFSLFKMLLDFVRLKWRLVIIL